VLPITFIDNNEQFSLYCQSLIGKKAIALDTEFLRVTTFYPKPGLFQINDGEQIVLADPCAITDWQAFAAVLTHPDIVKVFHACDEDIELLIHFLKVDPINVFDTQVAAAFCGYEFCMGYQRLVKAMLDVDVEKGHSRSDWMRRPLSDDQIHYAADDVRYLLQMYEQLLQKLNEKNLSHVMVEEYQSVLEGFKDVDFDDAYLRIKEAWKLNPKQFSVLRGLASWREKKMRDKDLPRKRIAADEALFELASKSHWSLAQLFEVQGLPAATIKAEGEYLMAFIQHLWQQDSHKRALKPIKGSDLYHRLKQLLEHQASVLGVDVKMLSQKNLNEQLYWRMQSGDFSLPEECKGWRNQAYSKVLEQLSAGGG